MDLTKTRFFEGFFLHSETKCTLNLNTKSVRMASLLIFHGEKNSTTLNGKNSYRQADTHRDFAFQSFG